MPSPHATPVADERRANNEKRDRRLHGQLRFAAYAHALLVTGFAVVPGMVFSPLLLGAYLLSGLIAAWTTLHRQTWQFVGPFLQGAFSVTIVLVWGPMTPMVFFMLVGQITAATLLSIWGDLIHSANR